MAFQCTLRALQRLQAFRALFLHLFWIPQGEGCSDPGPPRPGAPIFRMLDVQQQVRWQLMTYEPTMLESPLFALY